MPPSERQAVVAGTWSTQSIGPPFWPPFQEPTMPTSLLARLLEHPRLEREAASCRTSEGGQVDAVARAVERHGAAELAARRPGRADDRAAVGRCRTSRRRSSRCRRRSAYATRRPALRDAGVGDRDSHRRGRPRVAGRVARDGGERVRAVELAARVPADGVRAASCPRRRGSAPSTRNWTPATPLVVARVGGDGRRRR